MKVTFTKYTGPYLEQKVLAIRDLKNASGLTLMDAKNVVDSLFEKIPIEVQSNYFQKKNIIECNKVGFITSG